MNSIENILSPLDTLLVQPIFVQESKDTLIQIKKVLNKLKKHYNSLDNKQPEPDIIRKSFVAFLNQSYPMPRDIKYVCFGLTRPVEGVKEDTYLLYNDIPNVNRLYIYIEKVILPTQRIFRKCYRGLLDSYFAVSLPDKISFPWEIQNLETLRQFLAREDFINVLKCSHPYIPDWVTVLSENLNILSRDPFFKYRYDLFDKSEHEAISPFVEIGISDTSWFMLQYYISQIKYIANGNKDKFINKLNAIIDFIAQHPAFEQKALAIILERYVELNEPVHDKLKDAVLNRWGLPWSDQNRPRWALVSDHARETVGYWLKQDIIKQFFSVLSEDGTTHKARLKFWSKFAYIQNTDVHIIVGKNIWEKRLYKANVNKLFAQLGPDRLRYFERSDVSAFIMTIKNYLFVEFSKINNGLYIFKRNVKNIKKILKDRHYSPASIKGFGDDTVARILTLSKNMLVHSSTRYGGWETYFTNQMETLFSKRYVDVNEDLEPKPIQQEMFTVESTSQGLSENPNAEIKELKKIVAYCKDNNLKYWDFRASGGSFWIEGGNITPTIAYEIQAFGFKFVPNKTAWYFK